MNCEMVRKEMSLFLYGELAGGQETQIEDHLDACESCREEFERVKRLHGLLDLAELEPPPELLLECRRNFQASRRFLGAAAMRPQTFWAKLTYLFPSLASPPPMGASLLPKIAGAFALLAIGFFGGRLAQGPVLAPDNLDPANVVATRVRYVEPDPSGRIDIVVEETRRRTISGTRGDETIRNLLLAAAQDPLDAGLRVESVELLKNECDTADVRAALLHVLETDPNPGVRIKALEGLKPFGKDERVRGVIARVLLRDDNPGIRSQAIDVLVQSRERDVVGALQELMLREDNDYIRSRTQRLLREMNASVETF
jgi:anti-sigma factor RsiW